MIELRVSLSSGSAGWRDGPAVRRRAARRRTNGSRRDSESSDTGPRAAAPLEKRPQVPRLVDDDADVDVDDGRERGSRQIPEREHVRAEAQLKVDRGRELRACSSRGCSRVREVRSHRLLNQDRRALGQLLEDPEDLVAGHREIEDGIRLFERRSRSDRKTSSRLARLGRRALPGPGRCRTSRRRDSPRRRMPAGARSGRCRRRR